MSVTCSQMVQEKLCVCVCVLVCQLSPGPGLDGTHFLCSRLTLLKTRSPRREASSPPWVLSHSCWTWAVEAGHGKGAWRASIAAVMVGKSGDPTHGPQLCTKVGSQFPEGDQSAVRRGQCALGRKTCKVFYAGMLKAILF